jgi:large subunit ribosomal protein L24
MKLHVKKGDNVKVLSGDDKNQNGVVTKVYPKKGTAIVEGINIVKKHVKKKQNEEKGSIVSKEAPISISKLMVIDPSTNEATRIGRKKNNEGKLQRYSKKTGNFI